MASGVTNTAFLVGNGFSQDGQNATDMLVAAYRRTRQPALDALTTNQKQLSQKQIFFNSIRSKFEALQSMTNNFTASGSADKFITRKVASSDTSVVTVSASSSAPVGVSTLKVNRLATNDVLLADRMTLVTSFSAEIASRGLNPAIATGTKNFTLNGRAYSVVLDGTETNEGVMSKMVTAVNADADAKVSAVMVKDTASTGRLSFNSKTLGADGAVTFTDTDSLLSGFGLSGIKQSTSSTPLSATSNVVVSSDTLSSVSTGTKNFSVNGVQYSIAYNAADTNDIVFGKIVNAINNNTDSSTTAKIVSGGGSNISLNISNNSAGGSFAIVDTDGFLANYGMTSQTQSDYRTSSTKFKAGYTNGLESSLNSLATVNGIDVSRSTNSLSDVLTGVTINLTKAQASGDAALSLTTTVDSDAVSTLIQPFLDSFNDSLKYLQNNIKTSGGNDGTMRTTLSRLRSLSGNLYGSASDSTKYLSDIGIKIGTDGTLSIGNKDTLKSLLESDPTKVSKFFSGTDSFASQVSAVVSDVVGSTGLAQSRADALGTQIKNVDSRVKSLQTRIDREVEQQKKDYLKLQKTFYALQDQASKYSSYIGSSGLY